MGKEIKTKKRSYTRVFRERLASYQPATSARQWFYVPYDQLSLEFAHFDTLSPSEIGLVFCESSVRGNARPYHKQKLGTLLASQRQFAIEQAERGVAVRYLIGQESYAQQLQRVCEELGPLKVMRPAEKILSDELRALFDGGQLIEITHSGWLTTPDDFHRATKGKKTWRMDAFYRLVRRKYGVLLDASGKPVGGKWSYDHENREPWKEGPTPPQRPAFKHDEVTHEVERLVNDCFAGHPGQLDLRTIPITMAQVNTYWRWVLEECMALFGPYEDAMSHKHSQLFHTRASALINLHRIVPRRALADVLALDIPLNSKEGFVRQLIGWREYMHHVFDATDGLTHFPPHHATAESRNYLGAHLDLPDAYWGKISGFFCLDHVVGEVLSDGHSHHINRLMVLANWGTLLGIEPEQLNHWFWVAFDDAYEWVVSPNVFGMGTYALGDLMVTKPYVSGSAYVNKMSDYCGQCAFNPKTNCPMTQLYWHFLAAHEDSFMGNQRMSLVMGGLRKRSVEKRKRDAQVYQKVTHALAEGRKMLPAEFK